MNIAIFTEAGSIFGQGHLSRCTALKQGFEYFGAKVRLFVRGDISSQDRFIKIEWLENFDMSLLNSIDIAVIDSYYAPKKLYEEVAKEVKLGVWFDDTNRIEYPIGYIVDGKNSILLRKPFWSKKSNLNGKNKIFISFGKTDKEDAVSTIIAEIRKKNPEASFALASKVPKGLLSTKDIALIDADENDVAEAMNQCAKAVSAGGQTLLELASLGIPTVAVIIADNQIGNSKRCLDANHILGLVDIKDKNWASKAVSLLNKNEKITPIEVQTKSIANDILNEVKKRSGR